MTRISSPLDGGEQKVEPRLRIPQTTFERLLLESTDEVLSDLFGEKTRDMLYDYLAAQHGYGREEIPKKMDEFYLFLEHVFGHSSRTIGRSIIRRLFAKLNYEYVDVRGFELIDYLQLLNTGLAPDAGSQAQAARAKWVDA